MGLEALLVVRAARGRFVSRFPLFYSYIGFVFLWSVTGVGVLLIFPDGYATFYWFYYLMVVLAEFAVLVEISDHLFRSYSAIRLLGRTLAIGIPAVLVIAYVLPALLQASKLDVALLEFGRRISVTKAVVAIVLLFVARHYRVPLGRNISGMLLGFAFYLAISIADFSAAREFGKSLYADVTRVLFPLSYTVCLLVWNVALWRYEPVLPINRKIFAKDEGSTESLSYQLGRFNTALTRLFRR